MNRPDYNALVALRRVVFEVLWQEYGDTAVVISGVGNSMIPVRMPADPLAAAKVAKALMVPLRHLVAEYVGAGRGQGRSWLSVAQALGFGEEDWSPEYAAFSYVVGVPTFGYGRPSLRWRCHSCGNPVRDWGPEYGPHPGDREEGHARDCQRHSAAVRAYLDHLADE